MYMCFGEVELAQALENWCKNWCQIFSEYSQQARYSFQCSVWLNWFNYHNNWTQWALLLSLFYKGRNWGLDQFSSVTQLSRVWFFATPWTAAHQASLSNTNSWSLLKLMSIEPVMPSNHLILCWPLYLWPSIFPSIRVFSNESALHIRWPKYRSFSFSISPSNEYSGLISFKMDWLDLLAVQGTLKSLLKHHSSKASILPHSAFFIVQLSHPYMTTGLYRWVSFPRFHSWVQIEAGLNPRHSDTRAWAFISCSSQLYGLLCVLVESGRDGKGRGEWREGTGASTSLSLNLAQVPFLPCHMPSSIACLSRC